MMRYISLFSGIGGFEKGIQQAAEKLGIKTNCVFASEINKYARKVYKKNFGVEPYGDIKKINATNIPDHEILCGGFPCQAFSITGKRRGFEDTRGTLFFEIMQIVKIKRSKLLFLENVPGLLSHDKGKTFQTILRSLDEVGYNVEWQCFNSKNYGVPQNRERVFIVGHLRGSGTRSIFPVTKESCQINGIQGPETNTLTNRYRQSQANGSYIIESKFSQKIQPQKFKTFCGKLVMPNNVSGALLKNYGVMSGNSTKIIDHNRIRVLTPIECERLQGFPDNWTNNISDAQRYKCLGNAVTVNVIEFISMHLLKMLEETKHETTS